jgi:hypothetical protein
MYQVILCGNATLHPLNNQKHKVIMKNITTVLLSSFTGISLLFSTAARAQNCTATASGNNINVGAGQVVCVTSNISNANVDIASGGTLKVQVGYTLSIQNFNNFNGTLINNGSLIAGNINFGNGGTLVNNNQVTFNGTPNFNGTGTITNNQSGTITYNATFTLGNSSTINNNGTIISTSGDVSANQNTTINNFGRFEVRNGNFNSNGTLNNNGFFKVNNFINFNGGNVNNNCRFVVGNGFNNASVFVNDGLVWVTNTTTGKIQNNSGSWMNTRKGQVRGHDFHNNATLYGSGSFYFTGDTRQQGTFAGSYSSPDSAIKFYDASLTAPQVNGSFFDFGIQGGNVVRPATMVPGDTINFNGTCAQQTFEIVPLPLQLITFNAAAINKDVVLTWETAKEVNTQSFEIEYSTNGSDWSSVGTVAAAGSLENSYRFMHYNATAALNLYRLKMSDIDGRFSYSPVKSVARDMATDKEFSVYPNPFSDRLSIRFNEARGGVMQALVTDLSGKVLLQSRLNAGNGSLELGRLPGGIYFLSIRDEANGALLFTKKIIKN